MRGSAKVAFAQEASACCRRPSSHLSITGSRGPWALQSQRMPRNDEDDIQKAEQREQRARAILLRKRTHLAKRQEKERLRAAKAKARVMTYLEDVEMAEG